MSTEIFTPSRMVTYTFSASVTPSGSAGLNTDWVLFMCLSSPFVWGLLRRNVQKLLRLEGIDLFFVTGGYGQGFDKINRDLIRFVGIVHGEQDIVHTQRRMDTHKRR